MIHNKHQRVGVFIDVQNMYYSARNLFNRKVNFGNIVKKSVGDRQLIRAIAYVVSTKTGENQPFFDALWNLGIEAKEKELMEYDSGQKKADWDVGLTIDAIENAENLDVIVIISGDGDYVPLVKHLQHKGKIVEVAAFRETTATRLLDVIGKENYTNLSENKRSFLIAERRGRNTKATPELKTAETTAKIPTQRANGTDAKPAPAEKPVPKKRPAAKRAPAKRAPVKHRSTTPIKVNKRTPKRKHAPIRRAGVPIERKDMIPESDLSPNERALNN